MNIYSSWRTRTVCFIHSSAVTAGFVSGGVVPASARGKTVDGLIHVVDWSVRICARPTRHFLKRTRTRSCQRYTTLTKLAGIDAPIGNSSATKFPLDGFDQWSMITAGAASPRTEVVYNIYNSTNKGAAANVSGTIRR